MAGLKRGKLNSNLGTPFNLGAPSQTDNADLVYNAGINYVKVQEATDNNASQSDLVFWGNKSLLRDRTKLLSKANQADLAVLIVRTIKPVVQQYVFDPNDPTTWAAIYRAVKPFIQFLETNRAIRSGENENWQWQGDQDVRDVNNVVYNDVNDIDNGIYRSNFVYKGISAIEYIGIRAISIDGSTELSITEQQTF